MFNKKCPFCKEKIKLGATVCRYCHKDITTNNTIAHTSTVKTNSKNSNYSGVFKIIGILLVVFIAIPSWFISIPIFIGWIIWKQSWSNKQKLLGWAGCFVLLFALTAVYDNYNNPPVVTIITPENNSSFEQQTVQITGRIEPDHAKLNINDKRVAIKEDGEFVYTAQLENETNQFNFIAINGTGKTEQSLTVKRVFTEDELAKRERQKQINAYISRVSQIANDVGKGMKFISSLTSEKPIPLFWSDTEVYTAAAATLVIENSYELAQELDVPDSQTELHQLFLSALEKYATAMPLFRSGVDELNASKISQASAYIDDGNILLNDLNKKIKDIQH